MTANAFPKYAAADTAAEDSEANPLAKLFELDPELSAARPLAEISSVIRTPGQRLPEILETLMREYADRPALGFRRRESTYDPDSGRTTDRLLPEFATISYRQLWHNTRALAAAWQHHQSAPIRAGDFVATVGFASPDYVVVDLACRLLGAVSVPLQHNASGTQLRAMLQEANPRVLAVSAESLHAALDAADEAAELDRVVVIDYRSGNDDHRDTLAGVRQKLTTAGSAIEVQTLEDLVEEGRTLPAPTPYLADETQLAMILYTSGSTGTPKGAMLTESMVTSGWLSGAAADVPIPMIGVTFMPLNHMAGRTAVSATLTSGGTCYFTPESDLSTLLEDWALVRPTLVGLVPRVADMLFQHYQSRVGALTAQGTDIDAAEGTAKTELRQNILGGRVLGGLLVTAPLSSEMKSFIQSSLGVQLTDLYGSTEVGGVFRDGLVLRPPVIDYKLVDVPELGYYTTDKPYPRGELLVKSLTAMPGYYNRPDVTAEVFDADGYYRTGDVMAEVAADHLVYVDRRNNVMKLAQGEFVAVSNLETIYVSAPLVRQIFVYGNSERSYLLAVVVPTDDALRTYPNRAELKNAIRESLQRTANRAQLQSYEIPADLLIETKPFTAENGLLSAVGKQLRPKLKEKYGTRLEELYADLAAVREKALKELRHRAGSQPVAQTVIDAVQTLLDMPLGSARLEDHFADLGGDSLSALTLSNLLRDLFSTQVPVGVITGPATDLRALADYIETEQSSGITRATVDTVHGPDAALIVAADLTLDKFIDPELLSAARSLETACGEVQTVLLTGANGYLGRFLCLEWLQRLSRTGGKLVCVIRGENISDARARLEEAFSGEDPELLDEFRRLAHGHLEVIPGDIARPRFGVDGPTWERLARDVDLVVHPAALVNHVLPYSQLFQPNVVGTAEVIRLAISTRIKPVSYLSTVAVTAGVPDFEEDGDIRTVCPIRGIDDSGYANGYANSKWAGEVLLREAHDLCGVPARVFRADMILAHSRYPGQLNASDAFTRLILSLIATGIAPRSFYQNDGNDTRPRAHYDGLPADFVAEAITTLTSNTDKGFRSYDVMNPHDDGISVDTFVDWLIDAGAGIDIVDDYAEWLSRFETALRHLPEPQRRNSLLPLLDAYRQPQVPHRGATAPTDVFRKAVQNNNIGDANDIPRLGPALITKYVSDISARGLL